MTQNKQLFREDFPTFIEMPTRWMDNDAYGHMNNIVHYALIDTAVTDWQRNHGFFNEDHKFLEFMVVESGCCYFSEAAIGRSDFGLRSGTVIEDKSVTCALIWRDAFVFSSILAEFSGSSLLGLIFLITLK